MNERIRELADQILPNEKEFHQGDPKEWGYFFSGEELEKFAELIIAECSTIVQNAVNHREPASTYVGKIKQHFGVEE